ncbi:MAG: hypothetical protein ACRCYO_14925 [Bacteroidia bacterium]
MLRILIPIVFFAVFIGWILYRLVVKKDLKKDLDTMYLGLTFTGVWVAIYYFLFT